MAVALTTRAAVVAAPRTVAVEERPRPESGPGEVLVRVEGSGVCGSDLPVWEGRPWFGYPLAPGAPGHEGWGRIEATGERVCFLGPGAYADHAVVAEDEVVRLPPELDGEPFPGEPLACALNAFERTGIERGQRVAVVGVGFLGALLVQLAARAGADVLAIARRPYALRVARAMGAAETSHEAAPYAESCDVAIEAAGVQATLDAASLLVRTRGRLVIVGYHQDGSRTVDMQAWNWRGLDVVNAHERDPQRYLDGMRRAVDAVVGGRLDPAPLLTHTFPLERLGDAFETALARPDGFMKALVLT